MDPNIQKQLDEHEAETFHPLEDDEVTARIHHEDRQTRGFNRKNFMRNKPCPCGSKKKFKKCCWALYTK